ncbi:HNH endonuclease [Vibrio parahaemolyticus]|uniref:HNH endonuclease n=1 Tax=Vibrio parahaemolyticus TaxID=670 RepID=UPI000410D372|nr:HNH endonuclease [Vibrio parahaemolyticus]EIF8963174.1 HNH endonuclease [Vibrio parahaemolyticus]EIV8508665.1 HNH endonuclease [Vibrio parahaemolyticus]EJR2787199.1 HNH endonuclease [Vibrio parahaemolyticus]MDT8848644.1 HNH endonuclease [Vibrio parahaemolyticus]MDT8921010.1 HNH endonuclease [Vibrio parahaemolyticus]
MIWAIYVSDKPHSRINFPIGVNQGIWGVKESKKETVTDIKEGDLVAFVYSISWLKAEGQAPKGFSRVGKDQIHNFRGLVQSITIGRVTKAYYQSSSYVWPDDVYPHRFEFDIVEVYDDHVYFGTEFFNEEFVEAVRYSACTQGSVTRASSINKLEHITRGVEDEQETFEIESRYEGKPILKLHKSRERSSKLVKQKKMQVLKKTGKLECEVCSMDFGDVYGEMGFGFAECHHKNPLSLRKENKETKLSDLAIVCSNCHRMLHRKRPWLKVEELKDIYEMQRS